MMVADDPRRAALLQRSSRQGVRPVRPARGGGMNPASARRMARRCGARLGALPVPAILIDAATALIEVNPAAETFLNTSARSLRGQPIFDRLAIDAPLEEVLARVRDSHSVALHQRCRCRHRRACTGDLATCRRHPSTMTPGIVLLLISPREFAERLGRGAGDEVGGALGDRHGRDAGA